jgi:hypothetical protein
MPHPLDGARFKVVWAQQHLNSLKSALRIYLDKQTDESRSQPHMHPQQTWPTHVLRPIVPTETQPPMSGIIGDIVTNARAALDYIMWELAQRYFSPPLDITKFKDRKLASFPIFETPAEIKDCFDRLADRQIPAGAITEIKAVQPYNAGYEPIRLLAQLVNQDKHRLLLTTIGEFDHMTVEFERSEVDGFKPKGPINLPRQYFATTGASALQSDMQMKAKAPIYVTWKDVLMPREPLDRTLEQIIKCVVDIVPRFDAFLT